MQEDIESRTVALSINAAKMTGQLFKTTVSKYLAYRKSKQRTSLWMSRRTGNNP